jgi:hypothetical protein
MAADPQFYQTWSTTTVGTVLHELYINPDGPPNKCSVSLNMVFISWLVETWCGSSVSSKVQPASCTSLQSMSVLMKKKNELCTLVFIYNKNKFIQISSTVGIEGLFC